MNAEPIHIDRGDFLLQTGRHDLAAAEFKKALAADPNSALAHANLAYCYLHLKDYTQATAEAQEAIRCRPDFAFAHRLLGRAYLFRNRVKEAGQCAQEAIRLAPQSAESYSLMSGVHLEECNWTAALAAADVGLSLDPDHKDCLNLRAQALVKLGRRDEANATLRGALHRDPENAATHANQGWSLLHESKPREAIVHFKEALRLNPKSSWARAGLVEALKARNIVYRLMLRYMLAMSRLKPGVRWGIIFGAYIAFQVANGLQDSNHITRLVLAPLVWAYITFAVLTWIADPIFNLMLRLDPTGRHALSRDQRVAANYCAVCFAAALALAVVWLTKNNVDAGYQALFCLALMVPIAWVFKCDTGSARNWMALYAGIAAILLAAHIAADADIHYLLKKGGPTGSLETFFGWAALDSLDKLLWAYVAMIFLHNLFLSWVISRHVKLGWD